MVVQRNGSPQTNTSPSYRRVLLVNPPMENIGAEFMMEDMPLRLEYLAAYIRQHVEAVEVIDLTRDKRPLSFFLGRMQPDLVSITSNYMSTHTNTKKLAAEARRFGADVVVGGYQVTALPEALGDVEGPVWTVPVIANDKLYLRFKQRLVCYVLKD